MRLRLHARLLPVAVAGSFCVLLVLAPAAAAVTRGSGSGNGIALLAFLGLPSLHGIIEAIAKGFFSALAGALVPGFLKHGTVATIQHLVALPDPASWGHVGELESDMTYLGMSLMPVTVTVCTLRYWMMGLTGTAHPVTALAQCGWATFVLVIYRWLVEQTVAATNTLTHAILGFPIVANGLASIITVLFGGALLIGGGGVFGAFLVIVGVFFAAGLFASQVALTVMLALVFCAGPPFIALSPIPEFSHLARVWGHALMAIVLVPIGWTILFATAGALTLDATSFTGGAGGIPGRVEAAFAGLITFVLAVKLPLMLFGELRHILGGAMRGGATGAGAGGAQGQGPMPGAERIRTAHARLRTAALEGIPSLGRSAGRAAGAMGAPEGGPLGTARRGLTGAARRTGLVPGMTPAAAAPRTGALGRAAMTGGTPRAVVSDGAHGGVRGRLARAQSIIAGAPSDARATMAGGTRRATRAAQNAALAAGTRGATATPKGRTQARAPGAAQRGTTGAAKAPNGASPAPRPAPSVQPASIPAKGSARPVPRVQPAPTPAGGPARPASAGQGTAHPGRKVTGSAQRDLGARAQQPRAGSPKPPPSAPRQPKKKPSTRGRRPRSGS